MNKGKVVACLGMPADCKVPLPMSFALSVCRGLHTGAPLTLWSSRYTLQTNCTCTRRTGYICTVISAYLQCNQCSKVILCPMQHLYYATSHFRVPIDVCTQFPLRQHLKPSLCVNMCTPSSTAGLCCGQGV